MSPNRFTHRIAMLSMLRQAAAACLLLVSFTLEGRAQEPAADVEYFLGLPLIDRTVAAAPTLPPGYYLDVVTSGLVWPTALTFTPDGRILVTEKRGIVWVIEDGVRLPEPFINLTDEVMSHHDRGLLGITVHPDFAENGYVYLLYTVDHDGTGSYPRFDVFGRLTRYSASTDDPNVADLESRHVLVGETFSEGWPACFFSHVIGTVLFAADGTLLAGSGDAASYLETDAGGLYPECFGRHRIDPIENIGAFRSIFPGSLAGKIIRIDPETGLGLPSNPFFTGDPADTESKIWASGLRNPFRFSVGLDGQADPALGQPGTLYIGDVGTAVWEEINVAAGGENFGWPCYEGQHERPNYQNASPAHSGCETLLEKDHVPPTYYWARTDPEQSHPSGLTGATIVVGDIYQGTRYPEEAQGTLWYADYVRGWMAYTVPEGPGGLAEDHTVFSLDTGWAVDIRYDPVSDYMYFVNIHTGRVMRIGFDPSLDASPVGVAERLAIEHLYPNPATGRSVARVFTLTGGVHVVEVFDLLGRQVWESEFEASGAGSAEVDLLLDSLPSGFYLVRVVAPDGVSEAVRLSLLR